MTYVDEKVKSLTNFDQYWFFLLRKRGAHYYIKQLIQIKYIKVSVRTVSDNKKEGTKCMVYIIYTVDSYLKYTFRLCWFSRNGQYFWIPFLSKIQNATHYTDERRE
jgi:hypothetical protein